MKQRIQNKDKLKKKTNKIISKKHCNQREYQYHKIINNRVKNIIKRDIIHKEIKNLSKTKVLKNKKETHH